GGAPVENFVMSDTPNSAQNNATDAPGAAPGASSDPAKRFLEAIDSAGTGAQRVALPSIAVLAVLFFGLILPSVGVVESARRVGAELYDLEQQIGVHSRKQEARKVRAGYNQRQRYLNASPPSNGCGDLKQDVAKAKEALRAFEVEFANEKSNQERKEPLAKFVSEKSKGVEEALRSIDHFLSIKENEH